MWRTLKENFISKEKFQRCYDQWTALWNNYGKRQRKCLEENVFHKNSFVLFDIRMREIPQEIVATVLDCDVVGSEFEFQLRYYIHSQANHDHHDHHDVVPPAQISLTLSRHFSLSFIASGRSSGLHPVSSQSCCMYVRAGRSAFARSYCGVHRRTSLMSSSLLLQQCPACLVHLTLIVFVMGGRWPYSWCFVGCCLQDLFNIALPSLDSTGPQLFYKGNFGIK